MSIFKKKEGGVDKVLVAFRTWCNEKAPAESESYRWDMSRCRLITCLFEMYVCMYVDVFVYGCYDGVQWI